MKYILQFALIAAVYYLGELVHLLLPLPIPGTIYGLLLMFLFLQTGLIRLSWVEKAADFLLSILPMLFLPGAVGLMETGGLLRESGPAILVICALTTVSTLFVAGRSAQAAGRLLRARRAKRKEGAPHGSDLD